MRLLDTVTGEFKEVNDTKGTPYAILSHVWNPQGEQTYDELRKIQVSYRLSVSGSTIQSGHQRSLVSAHPHVCWHVLRSHYEL